MNNQKPGLVNDTKKSAKNLAQQVARQIAQEPLEILKAAGTQTLGTPEVNPNKVKQPQSAPKQSATSAPDGAYKEKIKQRDTRLLGALEQEIKEIRMQKEQNEQRVEMAEQQQKQQAAQQAAQNEAPPIVSSKPGRKMGATGPQGQKATAERQQKRVESPVQSST